MGSGKHKGGWSKSEHGTDDQGREVTAAFGRGTKAGETLIADGHLPEREFKQSSNHDHADGRGGYQDRGKHSGGR